MDQLAPSDVDHEDHIIAEALALMDHFVRTWNPHPFV